MDLYESVNFEDELHKLAYDNRLNKDLNVHSWDHTIRVVEYSKMIIPTLSDDITKNVLLAAYFHDVGRVDDGRDRDHGMRSAEVLREKVADGLFPSADLDSIIFAIERHSDAQAPNGSYPVVANYDLADNIDPGIAMCLWDADRLDLVRCNHSPIINPEYLNTDFAKGYANSAEHKQRYK